MKSKRKFINGITASILLISLVSHMDFTDDTEVETETDESLQVTGDSILEGVSYDEYYATYTPTSQKLFEYTDNGGSTCTITKYIGEDKIITIPKTIYGLTVTDIGDNAFSLKQLEMVYLPDTITNIGTLAFAVNNLTQLQIPNSVKNIGAFAFSANSINQLILPEKDSESDPAYYLTIKEGAFGANELTNVYIPDSVNYLGSLSFSENKLTTVSVPKKLKTDVVNNDPFFEQTPEITYR